MLGIGVGEVRGRRLPGAPCRTRSRPARARSALFVLLQAFASGAAALTGVESISNGVTAFRQPQARNAARTLYVMAAIAISLFLGVSWLAVQMHARPSSSVSVLSQIARATFPAGSPARSSTTSSRG